MAPKQVEVAVEKAAGVAPLVPGRAGGAVVVRTMSSDERKEWKYFLADVDEDGVEEYEVEALMTLFELNKLWRPGKLVGLSEVDLVSLQSYGELQPSEKGLLKRTASMATMVTEMKRKKAKLSEETATCARLIATPLRASESMAEPLLNIAGGKASGAAIANAMVAVETKVDIRKLLEDVGAADLPQIQIPAMAVWQLLYAAKQAAPKDAQVFTYVDFKAKELLPMWIPASAMAGKTVMNEVRDDADAALVYEQIPS